MTVNIEQRLLGKKIVVLYGGDSAEREISLQSGTAIATGLKAANYDVSLIDTKGFDITELKSMAVDMVFIALHGRGGEDGKLQGALDSMSIPYTGSGVLGSALSMDKVRSKQVMVAKGIPTAPFAVAESNSYDKPDASVMIEQLGGKVMVKPANEGSSIGMAMADNAEELHTALLNAFKFDDEVLVEGWIEGPEYTVSMLAGEALPSIRMETPREFYDYEAKYQSTTTEYHCPSGLSEEDEQTLQKIAVRAFRATDAEIWGRVDVMRRKSGEWQVLEINTVPGMTETSLVPKAARAKGIDFNQLVTIILENSARERA